MENERQKSPRQIATTEIEKDLDQLGSALQKIDKDLKVFYQEFIWAHYFRPLVKWDNSNDADYARAVAEAARFAHEPAASALPGYIAAPVKITNH